MKTLKIVPVKKLIIPLMLLLVISVSAFTMFAGWKVKEPYEVNFAGGKISGKFESLKANIVFDKDRPEDAKISATIDVESLATGFFIKTSHAKDALDADHFPTISFTATKVSKNGSAYDAAGNLTMKGVTKPVTIHFTFEDKGAEGVFKGGFKVVPKTFNITRNGSPDELTISLVVPVSKS